MPRPGTDARAPAGATPGSGDPVAVFVYGTLQPGAEAWGLLAPFARGWAPDTLLGALYDTGLGYPAVVAPPGAVMHDGDRIARDGAALDSAALESVPGTVVELEAPLAAEALEELDRYEDVPAGLYVRRWLGLGSGRQAWVYLWNRPTDGMARVPGPWPGAPTPTPRQEPNP